ncbi:MAG: hypothetical protein E6J35_08930 [Chloroflexi bacterium]|nr:MAG: hypothetical protein E6J35_08930 [Chloroflexota bacterium]TME87602.1 MAG: hypothetical protein E6I44_08990 [Chloroflexota bacterium]
MSRRAKALVAGIDTLIMGVFAFSETDGTVGLGAAELVLWGAVAAAAVCAAVVLLEGAAVVAWAAIGYVLFGALLTDGSPHWPLAALALALMPLVPRPNRSLGLGLLIASAAALVARMVIGLLV